MSRRPFLSVLFASSVLLAAEPTLTLNVWPALPPGDKPNLGEEKGEANNLLKGVVTTPTLAVYRPAKEKDTGAAVLIAPGGGFFQLSMGHEGADVATWLNTIGVTGIVLKYRIPAREGMARSLPASQDAQRAMSLIRANAAAWVSRRGCIPPSMRSISSRRAPISRSLFIPAEYCSAATARKRPRSIQRSA